MARLMSVFSPGVRGRRTARSPLTPVPSVRSANRPTITRLAVAGLMAGAITAATAMASPAIAALGGRPGAATSVAPRMDGHWVDTWVSMPQLTEPGNLPPAPFTQDGLVFADSTLRQTIHLSIGGRQLRLRFSNAFGGAVLPITRVSVAFPLGGKAGVGAIQAGTSRPVTFGGRTSADVPVGAQVVSDPLNIDVAPRANLTVTTYLAAGQASNDITSHPGSRTTSYLLAGDHTTDQDLPGATTVDHWYLLSGAEIWAKRAATASAMLGDSLTDGRGSTTNLNDRWPDQLLDRLQATHGTGDVAIVNQAAGGNRVLNDGLGPNALARLDRDVLAQSGVTSMIVFEGVNDIGTADATPAAQTKVAGDLIAAYDQIVTRAHALGIRVYGATITPFGGNDMYDDAQGYREAARQRVNQWIRTAHRFDAVIDFDRTAADPADPGRIAPAFDAGDHLHLNPAGYHALAGAVPARLFQQAARPWGFGFA